MAEYATDEEQVEELKKWWADNGRSIIAGVVLGLGGLMGWKYWGDYQVSHAREASAIFSEIQNAAIAQKKERVLQLTERVVDEYDATVYAPLAQLEAVKIESDKEHAEERLLWVVDHADQPEIQETAKLRLARLYIAQSKPDEALAQIEGEWPVAYTSLIEEIKGDAYMLQGDEKKAKEAFDRALLTGGTAGLDYLRMKRDDLGNI